MKKLFCTVVFFAALLLSAAETAGWGNTLSHWKVVFPELAVQKAPFPAPENKVFIVSQLGKGKVDWEALKQYTEQGGTLVLDHAVPGMIGTKKFAFLDGQELFGKSHYAYGTFALVPTAQGEKLLGKELMSKAVASLKPKRGAAMRGEGNMCVLIGVKNVVLLGVNRYGKGVVVYSAYLPDASPEYAELLKKLLELVREPDKNFPVRKGLSIISGDGAAAKYLKKTLALIAGGDDPNSLFGPEELRIHVGDTPFCRSLKLDFEKLHPFGYYIVRKGNNIVLAGKCSKATRYAVADFLKRFTTWREFGGEFGRVIPKEKTFRLPAEFCFREEPSVASYTLAWPPEDAEAFGRSSRLTCMATHAMARMVKKEYWKEHPEYFPEICGKRVHPGLRDQPWNPCMSNPDLKKLFNEYADDFFRKNPDALGIPMGVNDGGGDCQCAKCTALYRKYGNPYLEFYNMAAKELAKNHPGKLLAFIAYGQRSKHPSPLLKMEPNILVEVTGYVGTVSAMKLWQEAGIRHFGLYEYMYTAGGYFGRVVPACYARRAAAYLKEMYRKYHLTTFWEEYYPNSTVFDSARQYVIDELLWNMDADVEKLLADYYRTMYGPAAQEMADFFTRHEECLARTEKESFIAGYGNPKIMQGYTFADLKYLRGKLADARKKLSPGSPEAKRLDAVEKLWQLGEFFTENAICAATLKTASAQEEVLALARRGLKAVAAIEDFSMTPAEEKFCFIGKKSSLKNYKNKSRLAPLPLLEKEIDTAFTRLSEKMGQAKARTYWKALAADPLLGDYARTQLTLQSGAALKNLVPNGGFEEAGKNSGTLAGDWLPLNLKRWSHWKFPSSQAVAFCDTKEHFSGKKSVCLAENQMGSAIITTWPAEKLCRYRLRFHVKRNDENNGKYGGVSIRMKSRGKWIDSGSAILLPVPKEAVGKWVECSLIFSTPDREHLSLVPVFEAPRQGEKSRLWFDDVELVKLCEKKRDPQVKKTKEKKMKKVKLCEKKRDPQVGFAVETVGKWISKWGIALPELREDPSGAPGAFTAAPGVLTGDAEGLRCGLYAWARELGIDWFSPAEQPIIPDKPQVVPASFYRRHEPGFPYRALHICGCKDHFDPVVSHWMSFLGMNRRLSELREAVLRKADFARYGLVSDTTVHSYYTLIPPEKYFKKHPEFFSLQGGVRQTKGGQLCLSNPEMRKTFVAEMKAWLEKNPEISPFGICPNDGNGWCECEECRKLDTPADRRNGTFNGRHADFVRYICQTFPDRTIGHYCYSTFADFYRELPSFPANLTLSQTAFHCYGHEFCSTECPKNRRHFQRLQELKAAGVRFYIYDYYTYRWDGNPAPFWHIAARDFPAWHKCGVLGFLSEVSPKNSEMWNSYWPVLYTAGRMLYDPSLQIETLKRRWCKLRYGKAAGAMENYFSAWERAFDGKNCFTKANGDYEKIFQPEAEVFLAEAEKLAPENPYLKKSRRLYDSWKRNLAERKKYVSPRNLEVTQNLQEYPVYFVSFHAQLPDRENDTRTEIAADRENISFRITLMETRMDHLKILPKSVYNGDNLELFLADGKKPKRCYHFIIAPDGRSIAADSSGSRWNWSWQHHAKIKASRQKDRWIIDFTIPRCDIRAEKDFSFTAVRNRHASGRWQIFGTPAGGAFFATEKYIRCTEKAPEK